MSKIGEKPAMTHESSEAEPKLVFDILLSAHKSDIDARNLEKHFRKADIFAPELIAPDIENIEKLLNQLSFGENGAGVLDYFNNYTDIDDFSREQLRLIANSRKFILLADMPAEDHEESELPLHELIAKISDSLTRGDLKNAIVYSKDYLKQGASVAKQREQKFSETIRRKIKTLVKEHSELKKKSLLNVLITFGSSHSKLGRELVSNPTSPNKVTKSYNSKTTIFGPYEEAVRNYYFDREPSDELVAKGLLENAIYSWLKSNYHTTSIDFDTESKLLRAATDKVSTEDIKEIFELLSKQDSLDIIMEAHGIKMHELRDEIIKESKKIMENSEHE